MEDRRQFRQDLRQKREEYLVVQREGKAEQRLTTGWEEDDADDVCELMDEDSLTEKRKGFSEN